jgi:hypothetical protein
MQKVYVMSAKYHGDNIVLGVFSSKAKANEAKEWILKVDMYYKSRPQDLWIETFEMNGERVG